VLEDAQYNRKIYQGYEVDKVQRLVNLTARYSTENQHRKADVSDPSSHSLWWSQYILGSFELFSVLIYYFQLGYPMCSLMHNIERETRDYHLKISLYQADYLPLNTTMFSIRCPESTLK
jgi:hypothetical protein